jgi:hypothetical protein
MNILGFQIIWNQFFIRKTKACTFSYLGLNKTPQELRVNPGQFEGLLNENKPYDSVTQHTDLLTYYTNPYRWSKVFYIWVKSRFTIRKSKLNSDIATSTNSVLSPDFSNTLDWFRSKIYVDLQTQFKKGIANWIVNPINLHSYTIKDAPLQQAEM